MGLIKILFMCTLFFAIFMVGYSFGNQHGFMNSATSSMGTNEKLCSLVKGDIVEEQCRIVNEDAKYCYDMNSIVICTEGKARFYEKAFTWIMFGKWVKEYEYD